MHTTPLILAAAAAVALSACNAPAPAPEETADTGGEARQPAPPPAAPAPAPAAAAPAPAVAAPGTMPVALRGRWGMGPADCDPARADNKGLMEVAPRLLTFYESRATVTSLRAEGGAVVTALAFDGEGQQWTTETRFVLKDDGKTLVRTDKGWENGTFRYERCPA